MSKGIDYGMGQTNIDRATGIRFGVINMNSLECWAWEEFESDYGPATCGACGSESVEYDSEKHDGEEYEHENGCADYACAHCQRVFDSSDAFGDEPLGHILDDGDYKAEAHSDGDCFILKAPFFTRAAYCSPCAPGACYLTSPTDDGDRAYCFGHDWFEGGAAPYPVYSVATGELVPAPSK